MLKRIHVDGCRHNERLNAKIEGSKRLAYTGLCGSIHSKPIIKEEIQILLLIMKKYVSFIVPS